MTISLSKGQRIDLTKTNPGLTRVVVGLGWDTNKYSGGADFDLDASAFLLYEDGKAKAADDFVFYNNPTGGAGSVTHTGDNRTGEGDGDDEQIIVDFSKIPANIHRIGITVTIYDYEARAQNFGQVSNAFVRVVDAATDREVLRYDLGEDFSTETAVVFCEFYRQNADWKFQAIGSGFAGGLGALAKNYGLDAQ
ncbi:TerD family protein [Paenibacillus sp. SEL3]|jgi:tellurium resistance protein TerD|uniref:Chemical-damaging agent resistance protein C n=3 Tax=Paenibacillus TaxID=44249 RepID=A0A074LWX1_PAEPO|nr:MULTISPECIES: TerD family protein [Paenibacillus]KAF6626711.1 TerD family protein [Paenibacillus sp. EKM208P]MCF2717570.1 TerD family protein [Paenibacillus sp. UKAQ_18]AHC18574.1 chemical-damaging agent resistance protein C [Paenibacillus polymyxa CR1]ALA40878.1 chemical-damaging agent resistance protein C [Paenibacillus peoriae]AOK91468.1 chemical-damaging agent resistance protein C [Paenibacillus polymyxa]